MSRPLLHLDADVSNKSLHTALVNLGHDVTRTPNDWMLLDASDEVQLLGVIAKHVSNSHFSVSSAFSAVCYSVRSA